MGVKAAPSTGCEVMRSEVKQGIVRNLVVQLINHQNLEIHQILLILLVFYL